MWRQDAAQYGAQLFPLPLAGYTLDRDGSRVRVTDFGDLESECVERMHSHAQIGYHDTAVVLAHREKALAEPPKTSHRPLGLEGLKKNDATRPPGYRHIMWLVKYGVEALCTLRLTDRDYPP